MTKKKVDEVENKEPQVKESVKLPTLLYRCPGPHARQGGSYDYAAVTTEVEYYARLDEGFSSTLPKAVEVYELDKKTNHN